MRSSTPTCGQSALWTDCTVLPLLLFRAEGQPAVDIYLWVVFVVRCWELQRSVVVVIHQSCQRNSPIWPEIFPQICGYAVSEETVIPIRNALAAKNIHVLHSVCCHHVVTIPTTKGAILESCPLVATTPLAIRELWIVCLRSPRDLVFPDVIADTSFALRPNATIDVQPLSCEPLVVFDCPHE